jgi:chromosome segregation ATPase
LWLNEKDPALHRELGLLYFHCGDRLRALGHFQRAFELLPNDRQIQRDLGVLYPEVVSKLVADLGGKTKHVQNLDVHARNLQTQVEGLKAHVSNLEARNRELETHAANLEAQSVMLQARVGNVEKHASNLEKQADNLQAHANNLEAECARLTNWVESLQPPPSPSST